MASETEALYLESYCMEHRSKCFSTLRNNKRMQGIPLARTMDVQMPGPWHKPDEEERSTRLSLASVNTAKWLGRWAAQNSAPKHLSALSRLMVLFLLSCLVVLSLRSGILPHLTAGHLRGVREYWGRQPRQQEVTNRQKGMKHKLKDLKRKVVLS